MRGHPQWVNGLDRFYKVDAAYQPRAQNKKAAWRPLLLCRPCSGRRPRRRPGTAYSTFNAQFRKKFMLVLLLVILIDLT